MDAESWNRSTAAAQKIEDILRNDVDGPSEGIGVLAMVLASIASQHSKGPLDAAGIATVLQGFSTCFGGALSEIQAGQGRIIH